jgi:hypothetical protein
MEFKKNRLKTKDSAVIRDGNGNPILNAGEIQYDKNLLKEVD